MEFIIEMSEFDIWNCVIALLSLFILGS